MPPEIVIQGVEGVDAGELLLLLLTAAVAKHPMLGVFLAAMSTPLFALLARYVVKVTPAKWDDVGLEWLLALLKAFAGVIPPDKSE